MIHPLRLRLRVLPLWPGKEDKRGLTTIQTCYYGAYHRVTGEAVLEFENPLNGTWHPVEVVDDAKPD